MIFTDWIVGWDSVRKKWYKVHVIVDTEIIGQHFLRAALRTRNQTMKARRMGIIVEVQK